jgi:NAD(P)-dependent dehydrogenase (short-subunit alcohol dehydrogenase family)
VLTGATDGIGRAVAKRLARAGDELVLIARDLEKGSAVAGELKALAPDARVHVVGAFDLSRVADVRRAAAAVLERAPVVDVLVQCAGILPTERRLTSEGVEETFAVGVLARFVLAQALLPALLRSSTKTLVTLGRPSAGGNPPLDVGDVDGKRGAFSAARMMDRVHEANDVLAVELRHRHRDEGLKVFCVNPGVVDTRLHDNWRGAHALFMKTIGPLVMVRADDAAKVIVDLLGRREPGPLVDKQGRTLAPVQRVSDPDYRAKLFTWLDGRTPDC